MLFHSLLYHLLKRKFLQLSSVLQHFNGFPPFPPFDWKQHFKERCRLLCISTMNSFFPLHLKSGNYLFSPVNIWIIPLTTQWRIQVFPEGGANSQSGCANLLFYRKTAWKWKNLDPRGARVPGAALRSATVTSNLIHKNLLVISDTHYKQTFEILTSIRSFPL